MSTYLGGASELLRAHGLRRTPGRMALLKELTTASNPLSIDDLQKSLALELDLANLYRALESFEQHGIVQRFEFGTGRSLFELVYEKPHHHHVVCENCGTVADVPAADSPQLTKAALSHAKGFTRINRHSLEFYGLCTTCA